MKGRKLTSAVTKKKTKHLAKDIQYTWLIDIVNKFKYDTMMYPQGCIQEYNYGITDSFFALESEIHVKIGRSIFMVKM